MCVLRVSGDSFDPQAFLDRASIRPIKVFRVGKARSKLNPKSSVHTTSGFTANVSDAPSDDLASQVGDAVVFLRRHQQELAQLRSAPGLGDVRLDFPIDLRIDRSTVMYQSDYFPPELLVAAGALNIGIELTVYPRDFDDLARGLGERN